MLRFVVRRLLLTIPVLIGLSVLIFVWVRAIPGSTAVALLGERANTTDGFVSAQVSVANIGDNVTQLSQRRLIRLQQ